jgi:hypothetical protein
MTKGLFPMILMMASLLATTAFGGQGAARPSDQAEFLIVEGLTVDAQGNTVIPAKADPDTKLYYRRSGKPVLAPDGQTVTAGTFAAADGTAEATCVPSGTRVELHLSGLIPNAHYRLWLIVVSLPGHGR